MNAPQTAATLSLFEGYGIELEYMIVDAATLAVRPIADQLLSQVAGEPVLEVELGEVAWSNELALHVIEMKTNGPTAGLAHLPGLFQQNINKINDVLASMHARLLPTAMHPWMDPARDLKLWPHEANDIYSTFDRIFDCSGHGWANLQSMHINLPFSGDEQFAKLHAAMRLVLPILPALAASSPFQDGRYAPSLDNRLEVYRHNARKVPSVSGHVIPERVFSYEAYQRDLLQPIYRDLMSHDPGGLLHHEWVNARGCIARFDRMAIEIRLLDVQECPAADIAIAAAVVATVRALVEQRWTSTESQQQFDELELEAVLLDGIKQADQAQVTHAGFLEALGMPSSGSATMREIWQHLIETLLAPTSEYASWRPALDTILSEGCLARRIARAVGPSANQAALLRVYAELADCLAGGTLFSRR